MHHSSPENPRCTATFYLWEIPDPPICKLPSQKHRTHANTHTRTQNSVILICEVLPYLSRYKHFFFSFNASVNIIILGLEGSHNSEIRKHIHIHTHSHTHTLTHTHRCDKTMHTHTPFLTLPMLRLLSFKAQVYKDF